MLTLVLRLWEMRTNQDTTGSEKSLVSISLTIVEIP